MNRLLGSVLVSGALLLGGCVTMTPAGSQVRMVDSANADFVAECDFIGGGTVNTFWTMANTHSEMVMQQRNEAAESGADTIVSLSSGMYDMYRCNP